MRWMHGKGAPDKELGPQTWTQPGDDRARSFQPAGIDETWLAIINTGCDRFAIRRISTAQTIPERGPRNLLAWQPLIRGKEGDMNQIIYLVGLVVIVIAILAFFGIG